MKPFVEYVYILTLYFSKLSVTIRDGMEWPRSQNIVCIKSNIVYPVRVSAKGSAKYAVISAPCL